MSYFAAHYADFRYSIPRDSKPGFRRAQLGAIHAAAAHFSTRADPAIVTMPTGSGKTAVLIAACFVLRASRVLIITPSRLVREQVAEETASLKTLREAGAIDLSISGPKVFTTKKRITSAGEWEALRAYDVVVGTVQSISPEYEGTPEAPSDLFDLVLVDEAHHSPARTWQAVLDHFTAARRLLFTATPFRQDQREIKGRFIFTYDLRDAFDDGIFGEIVYIPVTPNAGENPDVAIAQAAERQLVADRAAGLAHRVMVRTDSRKRAEELLQLYEAHTKLRLKVITGDKSLRYVKAIIQGLLDGTLDGIVCVNMLGEGFNFPSLKIAAIHSPHRSLTVTLQFIGRFARTGGSSLGRASFLAIPSEIEIEAKKLYDARSIWQEVIQNLSATRVHQEARVREVLESFIPTHASADDLKDLSLYVLEPYYHVKVYQLAAAVDVTDPLAFPVAMQIVFQSASEAHNAAIFITRETSLPRWTSDERLAIVKHDLFIVFQDVDTNLLFLCASRRSAGLYEQMMVTFSAAHPKPLPLVRLNRALNGLEAPEFFNVGMRNRVASNTTESYRIITGSNADKAIVKSDGRLYHRGHVFGRATEAGDPVTIGLSSASKVWSNKSAKLPELIAWCAALAKRIASGRTSSAASGLDNLAVGEEIDALPPAKIIAVDWPVSVYRTAPIAQVARSGLFPLEIQLLDFDLAIDPDASTATTVAFALTYEPDIVFRATFSFETDRYIEPASAIEPTIEVVRDRDTVSLIHFLNDELPQFFTADLALVQGSSFLPPPKEDAPVFDDAMIEVVDWDAAGVDIKREFGQGAKGRLSIHAYIEQELAAGDAAAVYYDHGSGEIADFVVVAAAGEGLLISLIHCKGATGKAAGHRVGDIYEIVGQAVKSVTWALKQRILATIKRRFSRKIGSHRFVRGDLAVLTDLLEKASPAQIQFEVVAVQPGLKKQGLPAVLANPLASASDYLIRGGLRPLRVIGSA